MPRMMDAARWITALNPAFPMPHLIAGALVTNMSIRYKEKPPYIKDIWTFNSKLSSNGHSSDCGAQIQAECDQRLGDGITYDSIGT